MTKKIKPVESKKGKHSKVPETPKVNYNRKTPVFCLHHMHPSYCVSVCPNDDRAHFANRIRVLSQRTWQEIIQLGKHGGGFELIYDEDVRKKLLRSQISEDIKIIAFRYYNMKPMLGYRKDDVFHILALDKDRSLYKH